MGIKRWLAVLVPLVLITAATGCAGITPTIVTGSGKLETRDFNLSGFSGLQAATAFNVQISRADSFKVQVTADDNVWDVLDISVSGKVLHLQTKPAASVRNTTLSAVVAMPDLTNLDLSGGAHADANGFNAGSDLTVRISGAAALIIGNTQFGSAVFDISGGGKVSGATNLTKGKFTVSGAGTANLSGSGDNISIDASGGGQVILNEFPVQTISATLSVGAQAHVNTREITRADLSGGAQLYYADSPAMGKIQKSGGAALIQE